jgi:hypothetical protein
VAVAPLLVGVFGEFSLVSPVANVLAFPAVAPATLLGLGAAVVGAVVPQLGLLLGRAAAASAGWILEVADITGSPSWAAVDLPRWVGAVLAVPVLAAVVGSLRSLTAQGPSSPTYPSRKVTLMSDFRWVLQDEKGTEIRVSDAFDTQEAAEAWMGTAWQELVAEGGAYVVLRSGEESLYRMSLAEA